MHLRDPDVTQTTSAAGGTVAAKARDWKEPIGRVGLVGQGVVATIVGLLAIRIAMGDKDEAATSEGAVAWLAHQPFGKFLLVALTVALFAPRSGGSSCALMGDPVEGSEPKDRPSTRCSASSTCRSRSRRSGSRSPTGPARRHDGERRTVTRAPEGDVHVVRLAGGSLAGRHPRRGHHRIRGYNFYKQVIKKEFAERLEGDDNSWVVRLGLSVTPRSRLVYAVIGFFFIQAADRVQVEDGEGAVGRADRAGRHGMGQDAPVGDRHRALRVRRLLHRRGQVPQSRLTPGTVVPERSGVDLRPR